MTPVEATAALTYANQLDPRVPVNEANADLWASALVGNTADQVKWVIKDHYTRSLNGRGEPQTITPAAIRHRARVENERAAAKRAALTRAPERNTHPESWRSRNPAEWDRLKTQGAVDRLEQLERTGEIGADQKRLDAYRATGVLPNPGVTDWSWDDDGSTPW